MKGARINRAGTLRMNSAPLPSLRPFSQDAPRLFSGVPEVRGYREAGPRRLSVRIGAQNAAHLKFDRGPRGVHA